MHVFVHLDEGTPPNIMVGLSASQNGGYAHLTWNSCDILRIYYLSQQSIDLLRVCSFPEV
jgi:hypothetical protein